MDSSDPSHRSFQGDVMLRLIEPARNGDIRALNELLQQLQAPLYNFAVRMLGHREEAQDATQEILLKITTSLSTGEARVHS